MRNYHPNLDGAAFLVERVLPSLHERRPDVRVVLVGRDALVGPSPTER